MMLRNSLILTSLLAPAVAMAQAAGATGPQSATSLDLSVPQAPLRYLNDDAYQRDAPGTFYGDRSGRRASMAGEPGVEITDDKLRVNGSVSTGIGYSKRGGNSHYTAASLNLSKNYTTDEGKTNSVNLNIHVSEGEGPGFYGPYGGGYGGYGPYPYGPGRWDIPPPSGW